MTDLSFVALNTGPANVGSAVGRVSSEVQYLTVSINGQALGIPVLLVHDVLGQQRITQVPLAPPAILGSLNLRGRIVTAIDVRRRLGLTSCNREFAQLETAHRRAKSGMCVVVEHGAELYSLAVDNVGEVLSIAAAEFAPSPVTMAPIWRDVSKGIYRLPEQLLIILDIDRLIAGACDGNNSQSGNLKSAA